MEVNTLLVSVQTNALDTFICGIILFNFTVTIVFLFFFQILNIDEESLLHPSLHTSHRRLEVSLDIKHPL